MTHFAGIVLVGQDTLDRAPDVGEGKAFTAVSSLISQYVETDEWGGDGTRFDWFSIGGRWAGLLDPTYNPEEDARNYEWCRFCEGTGVTTAAVAAQYPAYEKHVGKPCIQCAVSREGEPKPRPGRARSWFNAPFARDVMPARDVDIERLPFIPSVIVTPDGTWHEQHRTGMFASVLPDEDGNEPKETDEWTPEFCRLLDDNRDTIAVVVDFHV